MRGDRSELFDVAVAADAERRRKFGLPPREGDPYAAWRWVPSQAEVGLGVDPVRRERERQPSLF